MTVQFIVLALALLSLHTVEGFSVLPKNYKNCQLQALSTLGSSSTAKNPFTTKLHSQSNDDNEEDEESDLLENQNLFRGIVGGEETGESKKKSKGKQPKGIKRPHDSRDDLPFLVQVMTPPDDSDLYNQQAMEQKKKRKKLTRKQRRQGIFHEDEDDGEVVGETLGEYRFEKNTGSGDKIEIDEQVYVVTKARCQYRYAGSQKFEMVRKILQVKPVHRAMQEDYIMRQFNAPSAQESE